MQALETAKDSHLINCPVCETPFGSTRHDWIVECPSCQLLASNLPGYGDPEASSGYSVDQHAVAFGALRKRNARKCLDAAKPYLGENDRIVEVGSAQGFFLQTAKEYAIPASGIEPNRGLYTHSTNAGYDVVQGFFPDALTGKVNGMIAFNDVFEHLPDIDGAMASCADSLEGPSVLLINLPMRKGIFYRIARVLDRFGMSTPFERLWQVGTMSPHLFYFDDQNLTALARKHGFELRETVPLDSIGTDGLWERIRVTSNVNLFTACIVYAGTMALRPLTAILPKDAKAFIYQKAV